MAKIKTEFELVNDMESTVGQAIIVEHDKFTDTHLAIHITSGEAEMVSFIRVESLERFAVNILKALKSKHLK